MTSATSPPRDDAGRRPAGQAGQALPARWPVWALAALCLAAFAALAPHLLYQDLDLDYPFVDGDSHDWLANGLFFAGHDVRYSGRPPLLPLALALLDRLGCLRWWPLAGLLFFLATVLGFHSLAARLFPPAAAFAAALLLLADYSLQGFALDLMADVPASCLLLWSARAFLTAGDRPRRYAWSGLLGGLSALTQPAALVLPLAAGAALAMAPRKLDSRRGALATPWPWIGAALMGACLGAWMLVRRIAFAAWGDSLIDPWRLLGFHLTSLRFYLWSLLSLLGLPACLLLAAGIALAVRGAWRARRGGNRPSAMPQGGPAPAEPGASLFALLLFAAALGFFACCYLWDAKRFLVYAAWPAGLLIARALAPLAAHPRPAGRIGFAAASALAIGAAALPLPEPARDGSWAALWPLPPLAVHASVTGGPASASAGAAASARVPAPAVARLAPAEMARASTFGRAAVAWSERPRGEARPDPALFAAAGAALYLYDNPEDGGGRYRTLTRLSNALRKPVRFVPRAMLASYWPLLAVSPPAQLTRDYTVYRVEPTALAGSWLLVTPGDRPLDPRLLRHPGPPASGAPARAAAEAAAIAAWVGRGNAYVALFPRAAAAPATPTSAAAGDPVELYLLLLLRTTELYVVEPRDAAATRALLARSPVESDRRLGGARLRETRVRGKRTAVISFAP